MGFFCWMSGHAGRAVRISVGAAIVGAGLWLSGGWLVLAAVGALPLIAGLFDWCLLAPLARLPFTGTALRARCPAQA